VGSDQQDEDSADTPARITANLRATGPSVLKSLSVVNTGTLSEIIAITSKDLKTYKNQNYWFLLKW